MAVTTERPDEEAHVGTDPRQLSTPRAALRVLVVDDDDLFRLAVRTLLETDRRLKVIGEAADGQQALDAAIELSPDVVLMDLDMPGMGGLEAITQIARRTAGPPGDRPDGLERSSGDRTSARGRRRPLFAQIPHRRRLRARRGRRPP